VWPLDRAVRYLKERCWLRKENGVDVRGGVLCFALGAASHAACDCLVGPRGCYAGDRSAAVHEGKGEKHLAGGCEGVLEDDCKGVVVVPMFIIVDSC